MLAANSISEGIKISNLTLTYQRHPAVHHLSCFFNPGTMNCIMGPNGGGKSTLLKALAGLHPIDEGTIERPSQLDLHHTAYLSQSQTWDRQFPMTVFDLAAQGLINELKFWKPRTQSQTARVNDSLKQVQLYHLKNQTIEHLSLGQFQRALLARVIVQNAQLILLDETLNGLDESSVTDFFHILHHWHLQGKTIIVVLHDRQRALQHFQYCLVLNKEMKAWGPCTEVLNSSQLNPQFLTSDDHHLQIKNALDFEEECLR